MSEREKSALAIRDHLIRALGDQPRDGALTKVTAGDCEILLKHDGGGGLFSWLTVIRVPGGLEARPAKVFEMRWLSELDNPECYAIDTFERGAWETKILAL